MIEIAFPLFMTSERFGDYTASTRAYGTKRAVLDVAVAVASGQLYFTRPLSGDQKQQKSGERVSVSCITFQQAASKFREYQ